MGKSIRSKIKRAHRAEFRRTFGEEAYQANLKKIQEKLTDCIDKQSLVSLDRLSEALDTTNNDDGIGQMEQDDTSKLSAVDVSEIPESKGENKVIVSKRSKRKQKHSYRMKAIEKKHRDENVKPKCKHRYHCAF